MKKKFLLLACLLALAIAIAGCGGQAAKQDEAESALLAELQITQEDVDTALKSMQYQNEHATEDTALLMEIIDRAMLLEAERQGLLPDREEARQRVQQSYALMQENLAKSSDEGHGAAEAWAYLQDYMAYMEWTEEEYLAKAADSIWATMANQALYEQFKEGLAPEQQADEWETMLAWELHKDELKLAWAPQLVGDELTPLLEGVLTILQDEIAVFKGNE